MTSELEVTGTAYFRKLLNDDGDTDNITITGTGSVIYEYIDSNFATSGSVVQTYWDNTFDVSTGGVVLESLFDANTILAANTNDTPLALAIAEQRIVGRKTGGNIDDLLPADAKEIIKGSVQSVSDPTVTIVDDNVEFILNAVRVATGALTVTLSDAWIANSKNEITIVDGPLNSSVYNITIETASAQTIQGETDALINVDGTSLTLWTDGSNVFVK